MSRSVRTRCPSLARTERDRSSYVPCAAPSVYPLGSRVSVAFDRDQAGDNAGRIWMSYRGSTGAFSFVVALMLSIGGARAAGDAKYPNWKGQWDPINPRQAGH